MNKWLLLSACLIAPGALAWDCAYEEIIEREIDLSGSSQLSIRAAAGELDITGEPGRETAAVRGRVCVSEEEWLAESTLEVSGGENAEIAVGLPDTGSGWSLTGPRYARIDLDVSVPAGLPLVVNDSSGDITMNGTGPVDVKDSSGDLRVEGASGPTRIQDSSGDIELLELGGDVTVVLDSSGDIRGRGIEGSVRVESDSSGDIRFSDVGGDFVVERDSSGDIVADSVGGDFQVMRDGSGEIQAKNVTGEVKKPAG